MPRKYKIIARVYYSSLFWGYKKLKGGMVHAWL